MFPTIFSLAQFQLRTLNIFFALAFIIGAFVFWRKGREEHYSETQLFDGYLLTSFFGFLAGRIGYIALNFSQFGWDGLKWLNIFGNPGNHLLIGLLGSTLYLARFAHKKKWDVYEILDFWSLATVFALVLRYVGYFFDGSLFGKTTGLPWGVIFPGVLEKKHPIQLYFAIFYLALFWFLSRAEYRYRTYDWYRAGKKSAQTGFLISVFLIGAGAISFLMSFLREPEFLAGGLALDGFIYLGVAILGGLMLFKRSGRDFFPAKKSSLNNFKKDV
jgi:phosphatidylglycerol---prolipoprotein diacylglyceryl transferase